MGFESDRDEAAREVRVWATRRMFEEEGWDVEWGDHDVDYYQDDPPWWGWERQPLTIERYYAGKDGVTPKEGMQGQGHYYVKRGSAVWDMKYAETEWVADKFKEFGNNSTNELKSIRKSIEDATLKLCADKMWGIAMSNKAQSESAHAQIPALESGVIGDALLMEKALTELTNWTGDAASVFTSAFGERGARWESVVQGDYILAMLLLISIDAQVSSMVTARNDALVIAEKTVETMWTVGEGNADANVCLLTIGAIVGVGLTAAGWGIAAAICAGVVSIASPGVSELDQPKEAEIGSEGEDIKVSGSTPEEVLDSMKSALDKVQNDATQNQVDISSGLMEAYDIATQRNSDYEVIFEENRNSFDESSDKDFNSEDVMGEPIHLDTERLKKAAMKSFPDAAEALTVANERLAETSGDEDAAFRVDHLLESESSEVKVPWMLLRDLAQDYIGSNASKVNTAGQVLYDGAKEMGVLDGENANDLEEVRKQYEDADVTLSGREHKPMRDEKPMDPGDDSHGLYGS